PETLSVGKRLLGIDRLGHVLVRWEPREDEGNALTLVDEDLRDRPHVLAACLDGGPEAEGVGPGEGHAGVLLMRPLAHPGDDRPVVEADRYLGTEVDAPFDALDDAHEIRGLATRRHEVDDACD